MELSWVGTEAGSTERLTLALADGVVRASSVVEQAGLQHSYDVVLDEAWQFRRLEIRTDAGRSLELIRGDDGTWTADGVPRPDVAAAHDIDLEITPFTNTLPLRRVELAVGDSVDVVTAWVARGTLELHADPQRYTRLAPDRYLFESLDTDFSREITVDPDGFVLEYPGLFRRAS